MLALETAANPMSVQTMPLPPGDPGTAITIQQMQRLIDEGSKDPVIHELAAEIVRCARVKPFDYAGEARAAFQWFLRNVRFTRDIRGKETLHAAREVVRLRIGDCDDFTIAILAVLQSIGHRGRIVTVATDPRAPDVFSHVYPEVAIGDRWIALDVARRSPGFGRTPTRYFRRQTWDAAAPEYQDVAGLGIIPPASMHVARARAAGAPLYYSPPPARARRTLRVRRLRGLAGLGQVEFPGVDLSPLTGGGGPDWNAITNAISAGTTGAANIIAASRASPYNLVPTTAFPAYGRPGSVYGQQYPPAAPSSGFFGMSTGTLVGFGLLLLVGIAVARR